MDESETRTHAIWTYNPTYGPVGQAPLRTYRIFKNIYPDFLKTFESDFHHKAMIQA